MHAIDALKIVTENVFALKLLLTTLSSYTVDEMNLDFVLCIKNNAQRELWDFLHDDVNKRFGWLIFMPSNPEIISMSNLNWW